MEPKSEADGATSAAGELPVIDWKIADERLPGGQSMLPEFVTLAKKEAPSLLQEIHRAIEAQDFDGLRRSAHTLKSCVSYFGAEPLTQAALQLEVHAHGKTMAGIPGMLAALENEVARFLAALDNR